MAEYIERDAVHNMVLQLTRYAWTDPSRKYHRVTVDYDDMQFGVDKIPSADVAPVVHGEWIDNGALVVCNLCGEPRFIASWQFCPCCGARMDGGNYNA